MIDRRLCLTALGGTLAFLGSAPARAENSADYDLAPVRKEFGLPALAAAAVAQGRIVYSGVCGVRALGSEVKAAIDDRFHLGSDTKAMTATLAGMMVEAGKLRWDSTIGEVLTREARGMNAKLAAVTLEQLLSHSSGIPTDNKEILALYFNTDAFDYNLRTLRLRAISAWRQHAPVTPPGAAFHYANLGYVIAGAMIEKEAGVAWEQLVTERIFEPLGLKTAGLGPQATTGRLDAPVGHKQEDDGTLTPMYWGTAAGAPPMIGPAGTAHMSVLDFARWAGWNAGGGKRGPALVKPETLARIHRAHIKTGARPDARPGEPREGEYAMGWGILKYEWADRPLLAHNGSNGMNFAKVIVDCDRDLAVVALTNRPGKEAEDAADIVAKDLYVRYAKKRPG